MLIYLAASLDQRAYRTTHELLRELSDALRQKYGYNSVYPHGKTLAESDPANKTQPPAAELVSLCRRLLTGDIMHPAPDVVWSVGLPDETARDQMALAETLGLPIGSIDEDELDDLVLRKPQPQTEIVPLRDQRWGATRILRAYFSGGERLTGVRGLPMEPRVGGCGSPHTRLDANATELAYASAVVRRAGTDGQWEQLMLPLLQLLIRDGHSLHRAAEILGLGGRGKHAREVRASKLRDRAIGCVHRAILVLEGHDVSGD